MVFKSWKSQEKIREREQGGGETHVDGETERKGGGKDGRLKKRESGRHHREYLGVRVVEKQVQVLSFMLNSASERKM